MNQSHSRPTPADAGPTTPLAAASGFLTVRNLVLAWLGTAIATLALGATVAATWAPLPDRLDSHEVRIRALEEGGEFQKCVTYAAIERIDHRGCLYILPAGERARLNELARLRQPSAVPGP